MKIVIGADPLGLELKDKVKKHLIEAGHEVSDVGTLDAANPVLYIAASDNVAKAVQSGEAEKGIVFCGTGMGVSIVANKHKGVYCAVVESEWAARQCRLINNANVLALGGRIFGEAMANDIVDAFLNTQWCENFIESRRATITGLFSQVEALENENFK